MDHETRRALQQQQAALSDVVKQMGAAAAQQRQAALAANQRKAIDAMTEVQGKLIDRAAAYTNLMLLGGYAGFFALWSGTRTSLPEKANIAVAALAGTSLAIFIIFEIYKMVINARRFLNNRAFFTQSGTPEEFVQRLEEFKREEAKAPVAFMGIWIAALGGSIFTALLAFGLLSYNYFAVLFNMPRWPS